MQMATTRQMETGLLDVAARECDVDPHDVLRLADPCSSDRPMKEQNPWEVRWRRQRTKPDQNRRQRVRDSILELLGSLRLRACQKRTGRIREGTEQRL